MRLRIEMHDLPGCVNTGVRTSGAHDLNRVISNRRQCFLNFILHGTRTVRLHLPATEMAAVVFDTHRDAHSSQMIAGRMGRAAGRGPGPPGNADYR